MTTRERIVEAARRVMLDQGLVRATTREIAREAGVSEGTLYNYFTSKEELFLTALAQLRSGFFPLVHGLPNRAGSEPVPAVLAEVAQAALEFYREAIPMGASIFADPALLARHRDLLAAHGAGPQRANEALAAYLRAEQERGRVRAEADPEAVAYLLLGAVYQWVYWQAFLGDAATPQRNEAFIAAVLKVLEHSLTPSGVASS